MPGLTEILLLALYLISSGLILLAARGLRRSIPPRVAAVLILLPLLFFLPALLTRWTPVPVDHCASLPPWSYFPHPVARNANLNDPARQALPWAKATRDSWLQGSLPWRDRWNGCGTPLAANGQSAVYAPWTILSVFLPLSKALVFIAALKMFIALAGSWLWLRELGLSEESALLGSILNGLSFSITLWLFWQQSSVIALWPWCLFLIERQLENADRAGWRGLVLVFALMAVAGHPESAALGALVMSSWLLGRLVQGDRRIARSAPRLAGAALAALGLTAFSLIPQVLAIRSSYRLASASHPFWEPLLSWAPHLPRWPAVLLTTFFPRALGDQIASPLLSGAPASFPELGLGYVGCVGWSLAIAVLVLVLRGKIADARLATLAAILALALGISSLTWPFSELASLIPGLRYVFPVRFLSCSAIAASTIAAFGVERAKLEYERNPRAIWPLTLPAGVLAVAALVTYTWFRRRHVAAGGLSSQLHSTLLIEATLIGLAILICFCAIRKEQPRVLIPAISLLAAGELLFQGARYYRYGDPNLLYPPTPLILFLNRQPAPFRVLGEGQALYPNSNVFAGVEEIRTHDPTERNDYIGFLDQTCGYDPRPYFKDVRDVNASALNFLNVKYLVAARNRARPGAKWTPVYRGVDGSVFENSSVLPRVFSPRRVEWLSDVGPGAGHVRDAGEILRANGVDLSTVTDWRALAYIRGRAVALGDNPEVTVSDYLEIPNRIAFRAVAPRSRPAVAVLSIVQDGGWTARDESGSRLETFLVNGPFLAVKVPGGDHRIHLAYIEPGFLSGLYLTLSTAGVLLAIWLVRRAPGRGKTG